MNFEKTCFMHVFVCQRLCRSHIFVYFRYSSGLPLRSANGYGCHCTMHVAHPSGPAANRTFQLLISLRELLMEAVSFYKKHRWCPSINTFEVIMLWSWRTSCEKHCSFLSWEHLLRGGRFGWSWEHLRKEIMDLYCPGTDYVEKQSIYIVMENIY